jgi:toxin ParE1/3/4
MSYHIAPRAQADLQSILTHIRQDSISGAERWLNEMEKRFGLLGEVPGMGYEKPDFGEGARIFPVGNYLILYRKDKNGVSIMRVVHAARDPENWL